MINIEKIVMKKIKSMMSEDPEKIFDYIFKHLKKVDSQDINIEDIISKLFIMKNEYYKNKFGYNFKTHCLSQKNMVFKFIEQEKELINFKDTFINKFPVGTFLTWDEKNQTEVIFKVFNQDKSKIGEFGGSTMPLKDIPLSSLILLENSIKIYA